jgi:hypothetical protein
MTITIESGITINGGILVGASPMLVIRNYLIQSNGNAQITTTNPKFGTGSFTSLASSGYLNVTPFSQFAFGTGDFTIEFWYNPLSGTSTAVALGFRPPNVNGSYPVLFMTGNRAPTYSVNTVTRITASNLALNLWSAVALVRYQGETKIYINGIQSGTTYTDTNDYGAGSCVIGGRDIIKDGTFFLQGNLDELRISSVARYTSDYTPATAPFVSDPYTLFLLHCDGTNGSNVFIDSTNTI